ncbi:MULTISPECIES: DUF6656 family protein [unclassified Rhizobium]|uniref:DUF6656 family protein n=1 Tax=unclassified Rhizobium TaxID=2613769 RepID=UPI001AD9BF69|nr:MULTISPECIES: DUF6656 family protein [unclassified Rhizobium]MBO9097473.1 hypothetical protein [Rhizobium sp. L58/93]MBO9133675.1 hypothetical protein [Rhizobium sp. B209b/85]MBO9167712.1 hypothetical protein [Rhizobium sp. L245/93]MBO9183671.1 hypothetical protein [Rhizobium sp. E27B/91]QXZ83988.1 hypothetical protein J5287_18520 [Rhizobium sp. K1/93]
MAKLRYFDAKAEAAVQPPAPAAIHSEFLRTGRITREKDRREKDRRYLSYDAVAERTALLLQAAGEKTHERLNGFHRAIQFPKLVFHRTLAERPHLGYCHVTASRTQFAEYKNVSWAFYIANFYAEIDDSESSFVKIDQRHPRMYFAVAVEQIQSNDDKALGINRAVRGNGVLFRTVDPQTAIRNVLLLGARNEQLRDIIRQL